MGDAPATHPVNAGTTTQDAIDVEREGSTVFPGVKPTQKKRPAPRPMTTPTTDMRASSQGVPMFGSGDTDTPLGTPPESRSNKITNTQNHKNQAPPQFVEYVRLTETVQWRSLHHH